MTSPSGAEWPEDLGERKRIPTGFKEFDDLFDGGVPTGSLILLSGDLGAGAPEFAFTSAALLSMARHDPDTFSVLYGEGVDDSRLPGEAHYLSVTRDLDDVVDELRSVLSPEMFDALRDTMEFRDFSESYFHKTPVPRSWVTDEEVTLRNLAERRGRGEQLLSTLADHLDRVAPGNLVILNSLTSLVISSRHRGNSADLLTLMEGVQKASKRWGGVIYGLIDRDALADREYQELAATADGVLRFEWTGDTHRHRTLYLHSFRGLMGELSDEAVLYETEITGEGFRVRSRERIQ